MLYRSVRAWPALWLVLAGCDDTYFSTAGTSGGGEGWCAVTQIFDASCVSCHSPAGGLQGSLDLQTDPYGVLVDMPSALYDGRTLVVPDDAAASFLLAKLENTQAAGEGGLMPLTGALQQAQIDTIAEWIDDGASDVCATTTPVTTVCNDTNEECAPGTCNADGAPTMLPGANCLGCHENAAVVEEKILTLAGTAFVDLQGSALLAGATIRITDADNNILSLTTNANGNFFTNQPIAFPFTASIEVNGSTREMITPQSNGACNSCHQCGGQAGGKLYGQ